MVEITSKAKLEAWLEDQPRDVCVAIAARAAWRTISNFGKINILENTQFFVFLRILRASAAALLSERFSLAVYIRDASYSASMNADMHSYFSDPIYAGPSIKTAVAIRRAIVASVSSNNLPEITISSIESSIVSFVLYNQMLSDFNLEESENIINSAIYWDAHTIASGDISSDLLLDKPLWPEGTPNFAEKWNAEFRTAIAKMGEGFDVWLEWYEAVLKGGPRHHDAAFARAINDLALWDKSPAEINAQIRKWVEEEKAGFVPEETDEAKISVEEVTSVASPVASINSNGRIDATPNRSTDRPIVDDDLPTLPLRQQAVIAAILGALGRNAPASLKGSLESYSDELRIRGVQPILGLLNDMFAIAEGDRNARDASEWLTGGLLVAFQKFAENHAAFLEHFPLNEKREDILSKLSLDESKAPSEKARSDLGVLEAAAKAAVDENVAEPNLAAVIEQHKKALDVVISTPPPDLRATEADRLAVPHASSITFRKRVVASIVGFAKSIVNLAQTQPIVATATSVQILESKTFEALVKAAMELLKTLGPFIGL